MEIEIYTNDELKLVKPLNIDLTPMFIYFRNQEECYPDHGWIDNPLVILGWWTNSLVDLLNGGSGQDFCFMEGAFELNAVMDNNCILLKSNDGRITWKVNCQQFAGSLISALKTASRLFYEIGHPELTNGFNEGIKQVREALTKSFPR